MFGLQVRTNSKEGKTPLYTRLKVEGKSIWVNLQLPVDIQEWNEVSISERKLSNFLDRTGYSKKLAEIEFGVKDLRKRHSLTQESLENIIKNVALAEVRDQFLKDEELERKLLERKRKDVKNFVKNYIDGISNGEILNTKGKKYADNSIKIWKQFRRLFLECYKNKSFTWEEMTQSIIHQFINYLDKKGYMGETKNRYIGAYRTIISVSEKQQLHTNGIARKWLAAPKVEDFERRTLIYLTKDELKALYYIPLSGMKERVRDLFLIGCYTAMRYDEFSRIEKGCIGYTANGLKVLRIKQDKVHDKVVIPIIDDILETLLKKYDYTVPEVCEQIMNRYIKEICKDLSDALPSFGVKMRTLLTKTEREAMEAGKKKYEFDEEGYVIKPRWDIVCCHTARRTAITNMYLSGKYTNIRQIMNISGHKKEETFMRYVRLSPDEKADEIANIATDGLF